MAEADASTRSARIAQAANPTATAVIFTSSTYIRGVGTGNVGINICYDQYPVESPTHMAE